MKKMIPPFLFLACILLILGMDRVVPSVEFLKKPYTYLGWPLIILGMGMTVKVRRQFSQKDTEIHTFKEPRKLVTKGLFRLSRNPIYLGFTLSLLGVWVQTGDILPIIPCLLFFLAANFWYIPHEEKIMEQTFGGEYRTYRSEVRRWI